jgi:hypothetical protein
MYQFSLLQGMAQKALASPRFNMLPTLSSNRSVTLQDTYSGLLSYVQTMED